MSKYQVAWYFLVNGLVLLRGLITYSPIIVKYRLRDKFYKTQIDFFTFFYSQVHIYLVGGAQKVAIILQYLFCNQAILNAIVIKFNECWDGLPSDSGELLVNYK